MSKMKGRSTAIFCGLAIVLAGYTYWEYKKADMHAGDTEQEKRMFFFTPEGVKDFKITRGGETIEVVREGANQWKIVKPFEDVADKSAVDALLYSIMIQKGRTFRDVEEAKNTKWSDFGLEPAGYTIDVNTGKKTESLAISSKNAYDGSYFIRQGNELMLGDHGLAQIIQRDPATIRSKRMFRGEDGLVQSARVEVASDKMKDSYTITIARDGGARWQVEPKPNYPLDVAKIESWLSSMHALNAAEVAAESLTEDKKREFLMLKPSFKVQMKFKTSDGKENSWEIIAGQDRDDDVFAVSSGRPTVYKLSRGMLSSLRVNREFFRDGKVPFKLAVEQAQQIIAGGREIEKDGSNWKLKNAKPGEELDQDKLSTFMHNLTQLEAQSFTVNKDVKGAKPGQRITVRDGKGQVLLDLSWGEEFKAAESWNKGMTFRFVKTNLEKEVLGVNAAKIASLADAKLVSGPKTEKK